MVTPDILFWFYKDFKICRKRLKRLRRLNKNVRIFALYGGSQDNTSYAETVLNELVDDFYAYPYNKSSDWKWKNGDQMIVSWYMERGVNLEWDTIFVVQGDMMVLSSLDKLFKGLKPDEIVLSGYRPISTVSTWWPWVQPDKPEVSAFKKWIKEEFNYDENLFVCLFIVVCLPRIFLEKYAAAGHPEIGFLEYKIPTLARIFGIPVYEDHNFEPWWAANPATKDVSPQEKVLNGAGREVELSVILRELSSEDGKRVFHPVSKSLPAIAEKREIAKVMYHFCKLSKSVKKGGKKLIQKNISGS